MKTQWLHMPASPALKRDGEIGDLLASQPSHKDKPLFTERPCLMSIRQIARGGGKSPNVLPDLCTRMHTGRHSHTMHPHPKIKGQDEYIWGQRTA